ncbi:MAG: GNAT family N-acetyltransferase [Candidatus Eremiobacteraeota bacterium]|nr:GNAT family N-acetyltransferase [Candidatus Eremiobacteraeota bacterium]
MIALQAISRETEDAALSYLRRDPYLNVFIIHALAYDRAAQSRDNLIVAADPSGVAGVAYYGRQLAIAADASAIAPFAELYKQRGGANMIVGARATLRAFWRLVRPWHPKPRLVRERQLVMMVDRSSLREYDHGVLVRHARLDDAGGVAESSAAMIEQELGYASTVATSRFSQAVRRMIERRLWWVGTIGGQLCFFCNVGPWCERTVQLQGVWTPPHLRRRGLATAALGAICDRLLAESPSVSLYVNDFNTAAIALYRRVGFRHVGDFQTLLF